MALSRLLKAITPQAFTSDGTSAGVVTIASTIPFKIGQIIIIKGNTLPDIGKNSRNVNERVIVKDVLSFTQLVVGPQDGKRHTRTDIGIYTTALSSAIEAPEQIYVSLFSQQTIELDSFEAAPTNAKRVINVDELGNLIGASNPLPTAPTGPIQFIDNGSNVVSVEEDTNPLPVKLQSTTGDINITAGDLNVQLSHIGANADSVRIGDGAETANVNSSNELQVRDDDANTSLTAINSSQLPDGHNVTIDNASGGSAVNIQDGGNSITVDATDLDIRDLAHTQDSVSLGDGTTLVDVTANNELNVKDADLDAKLAAALVIEDHDHLTITYRTSGNGIGEIDQVAYRTGGGGGSVVATLTLVYDGSDRLSTVTKT